MIRIAFNVLMLCGLLVAQEGSVTLQNGKWRLVTLTDEAKYYIDKTTQQFVEGNTRSWERVIFTDREVLVLAEVDCAQRRRRLLQLTTYPKDVGATPRTKTLPNPEWQYVVPDSIGETLLEAACEPPRPDNVEDNRHLWLYVAESSNKDKIFIANQPPVKSGNFLVTWVRFVSPDRKSAVTLEWYNCAQKEVRVGDQFFYEPNGLESFPGPTNLNQGWKVITHGSLGEATLNAVCKISDDANSIKMPPVPLTPAPVKPSSNSRLRSFALVIVSDAIAYKEANRSSDPVFAVEEGDKLRLVQAKPVGPWYKVIGPDGKTKGWLHGGTFKIVYE